jgi:hypothetical protein
MTDIPMWETVVRGVMAILSYKLICAIFNRRDTN